MRSHPGWATCLPVGKGQKGQGGGAKYDWIIGQNFDLIPSPSSIAKGVHTGPKIQTLKQPDHLLGGTLTMSLQGALGDPFLSR